jgi:hypothetical protein
MSTTTQEFQQSPEPPAPVVTYSTTFNSPAPTRLYQSQAQPDLGTVHSPNGQQNSQQTRTAPLLYQPTEAEIVAAVEKHVLCYVFGHRR